VDWKQRIRNALARRTPEPDEDVVDELAEHARAMYDSARADGSSKAEAERHVELQVAIWADDAAMLKRRERRPARIEPPSAASSWSTGLIQDIRYAVRLCRRQATFTLLVVCTMALGIGATTVLFSLTYGVLMKPLPWPDADRLVLLQETRGRHAPRFGAVSNAAYLTWREEATTIEDLAAWSMRTATLVGAGEPERLRVTAATASLFRLLGARPIAGVLFEEKDELQTDAVPVVLAERLWRHRFGGDPGVLGRLVELDGRSHRIVGVLQDRFAYPDAESRAFVPFHVPPTTGNSLSMFSALAMLRPGVTPRQAADEGTARGRLAPDTGLTTLAIFGGDGPITISAQLLRDAVTADVRRPLVVLLGAVLLLLVTGAANVAGLQLARASTRGRELAIRAALGAGSARVMRQLLVESLVLGASGGLAGLGLAALLHRVLPSVLPADFPRLEHVGMDSVVLAFALTASLLAGVAVGLAPALRSRRLNLAESLAEDGMAPTGGGRSRTGRLRLLIMAAQVAIACILLVGGSLLGRSFFALLHADRGFDPSNLLTARLSLPASMYTPERRYAILEQILDRLAGMPGVTSAGFTSELPLSPGGSTGAFTIRSRDAEGGVVSVQASPRIVSPRAFTALGMRVLAGRGLQDSDTQGSLPVVVVNEAFARRYLGDSPLDARLPMAAAYQDTDAEASVVGIVDDFRYPISGNSSQPEMYFSYRQLHGRLPVAVITLLVRTPGDPTRLSMALHTAVREADARLVPEAVMTMEDRVRTSLARPRLYAVLLGSFAGAALLMAAVGLFGVLSYTVAQRSRELAVRTALGARPVHIVRLVLGQGLAVTVAGLAVGLLASVVLTRAIAALLYAIAPHDSFTFVAVPVVVVAVAAAACMAPACRAARIDPLCVLKNN
jgi:putative ABC transport system permease protein